MGRVGRVKSWVCGCVGRVGNRIGVGRVGSHTFGVGSKKFWRGFGVCSKHFGVGQNLEVVQYMVRVNFLAWF